MRNTRSNRRKANAKGVGKKQKEYMPKKWNYNDWYFGNKWSKMSKSEKASLAKEKRMSVGKFNQKWKRINKKDRAKITNPNYPI